MRTRENKLGSPFLLPFIWNQGALLVMEGNSFLQKKKEDFYSIQKNQLDNFKMITTQTNILFELLNQKILKQINKIRFKTIIIIFLIQTTN